MLATSGQISTLYSIIYIYSPREETVLTGNGSAILGVGYSTGQELQSNSSLGSGTPAEGGWFSNREGIAMARDVERVWAVSNSDGGQGAEGEVENRTHIDSVYGKCVILLWA